MLTEADLALIRATGTVILDNSWVPLGNLCIGGLSSAYVREYRRINGEHSGSVPKRDFFGHGGPVPDLNWFINGSFLESGSSIDRDAEVLESIARERFGSISRASESWRRDPYDPELREGLLMCYSERPEFDAKYPGHPLSKVRELVRFITRNN